MTDKKSTLKPLSPNTLRDICPRTSEICPHLEALVRDRSDSIALQQQLAQSGELPEPGSEEEASALQAAKQRAAEYQRL